MKLSDLIKELNHRLTSIGDLDVECIHTGQSLEGYHELIYVTVPIDRRIIALVTRPAEWSKEWNNVNMTEENSSQP